MPPPQQEHDFRGSRHPKPMKIVDAERHRRTPRLSAISGKAIRAWVVGLGCGRFNVRRWQILATFGDIRRHLAIKATKKWATGVKISANLVLKSNQNLWKIKVASRMRFWSVLGRPWGAKWSILGDQPSKYHQNGSQNESKIDEKSRLHCGCVFGTFLGGPGAPKCHHIL